MDLKALREQAINEANGEIQENNINIFKGTIKNIIYTISQNNAKIVSFQKDNAFLKTKLTELELKEFDWINL